MIIPVNETHHVTVDDGSDAALGHTLRVYDEAAANLRRQYAAAVARIAKLERENDTLRTAVREAEVGVAVEVFDAMEMGPVIMRPRNRADIDGVIKACKRARQVLDRVNVGAP